MGRIATLCVCVGGLALATSARAKVTFEFDYSYDTNNYNFFNPGSANGQAARDAMSAAAHVFEDRIVESNLSAITPGGVNSWSMKFFNPGIAADTLVTVNNPTVATNTIRIYAAGRPLGGALGLGGPGGYSATAGSTQNFQNAVQFRGQTAASATVPSNDFGPWGGTISFDPTPANAWNFNLGGPVANQNDFLTAAMHELLHVLGLGTSPAWKTRLTSKLNASNVVQYVGPFTGTKAQALYGGPVPLESSGQGNAAHFAPGVTSTFAGHAQETLMDPDINVGTRKGITLLDWAALDDIGWDLAMPGDANADGAVNFSDLIPLAQNYNVTDGQRRWSDGDFTYDGNVDFNDLIWLAQNYNTTGLQGAAVVSAAPADFTSDWQTALALSSGVPEPASAGVIALIAVGVMTRRSTRRAQ